MEDGSLKMEVFIMLEKTSMTNFLFFPLPASLLPAFIRSNAPQPEFGFPDARLARFFEW